MEEVEDNIPAVQQRKIYVILAFLMGLLGIHNFYAKRYKTAIAQALITLSLFWTGIAVIAVYIWVLFDVFIVRRDGNGNLMFEESPDSMVVVSILMVFPGILIIFLAAIVLSASSSSWFPFPGAQSQIKQGALSFGRLADYPTSAKNFKTGTAGSPFTRQFFVCFEASAQDIKDWIAKSEGLKGVEPKIFTEIHQYLPYPNNLSNNEKMNLLDAGHEYYSVPKFKPDWINSLKIKNGRKYLIPGKEGHGIGGALIVNDDTNTVYIDVSWS